MPRKSGAVQMRALRAAERTLNGIKFDKFWDRVIRRVTPKADANARVRSKSLAKASRCGRVQALDAKTSNVHQGQYLSLSPRQRQAQTMARS